jgi:hypothetical protein
MELPDASIQSGFAAMVSRSAEAIRSGLVVAIGEIPVRLHAPEHRWAFAMAELLAGLDTVDSEPDCVLTFGEGGPSVPSRPPDDELHDGQAWQHGTEFALRHNSGLVAVADATTASIWGDATRLRWPFRRLFHPTIAHLLAHQQRYVVHSAAIADDDGAVLVFGGSGRGKSTAAAAALLAGHDVLGDDLVVLAPRAHGVHDVVGLPRPMAIPGDVIGDVVGNGAVDRDPRARVELPPDRLSVTARRLRAVIIIDHSQGSATLEPVAPSVVLGEVLSSFTATRNSVLRRAFFPHALMLSRVPAWRLRHARNPASRLDEAAALLAAVQASVRGDRS